MLAAEALISRIISLCFLFEEDGTWSGKRGPVVSCGSACSCFLFLACAILFSVPIWQEEGFITLVSFTIRPTVLDQLADTRAPVSSGLSFSVISCGGHCFSSSSREAICTGKDLGIYLTETDSLSELVCSGLFTTRSLLISLPRTHATKRAQI